MKKLSLALAAIASSLLIAGCGGGGGGGDEPIAADNLAVSATASTTSAVVGETFTFPAVPAFGTTGTTTLAFTSAGSNPAFAISADGNTARGTTAFGSCIFNVTESTFPADHPLGLGKQVTVNPCSLTLEVKGVQTDNDETKTVTARMTLGTTTSAQTEVQVVLRENGDVVINGTVIGKVGTFDPTGGNSPLS